MAPQTSFGLGFRYDLFRGFSIDADYNYYQNLFGEVAATDVINAAQEGRTYQSEELPAYYVIDAGLSYSFNFGGNTLTFRGNVYNVANHIYLSQREAYGYFYGNGRTWNASVRYNF